MLVVNESHQSKSLLYMETKAWRERNVYFMSIIGSCLLYCIFVLELVRYVTLNLDP